MGGANLDNKGHAGGHFEMQQSKTGNQCYFGVKVNVGMDRWAVIHAIIRTDVATTDVTQLLYPLHGQEKSICGDKA
jgi:IS5 family transposase